MSVLIVEDDAVIRQMVGTQLADRGVTSAATATLGEAREALGRQEFGIVILDSSLPDGSGLDLLRELRRSGSTTHVIVLSGATREVDRLRTLDLGADDHVVKPFFARELVARVLGVRRRRDPKRDFCLRAGHLEIDVAARVALASGKPLELAAKEFDLLAFLAARPGHVFSREDIGAPGPPPT